MTWLSSGRFGQFRRTARGRATFISNWQSFRLKRSTLWITCIGTWLAPLVLLSSSQNRSRFRQSDHHCHAPLFHSCQKVTNKNDAIKCQDYEWHDRLFRPKIWEKKNSCFLQHLCYLSSPTFFLRRGFFEVRVTCGLVAAANTRAVAVKSVWIGRC